MQGDICSERKRERETGEEWVRVEEGFGGVNFNMSFLKLSFDNWQFVQLVKCQESKKIDEVHNRCLRLTLRCALESHARIRPPKRYRNEISLAHAHTRTHGTNTQTDTRMLDCWRAPLIWKTGPRQFSLGGGCDFCLNREVSFKWLWPLTEGL